MGRILIKKIEYKYSMYGKIGSVNVEFDFGFLKNCKIRIPVDELDELSDKEIKKYILNIQVI